MDKFCNGVAACAVVCPYADVLPGGKTTDYLHDNRRKFASSLLKGPIIVIVFLHYQLPVNDISNCGNAL